MLICPLLSVARTAYPPTTRGALWLRTDGVAPWGVWPVSAVTKSAAMRTRSGIPRHGALHQIADPRGWPISLAESTVISTPSTTFASTRDRYARK